MIIEKDSHNWKRLWLLKKIMIIGKTNACDKTYSVVI